MAEVPMSTGAKQRLAALQADHPEATNLAGYSIDPPPDLVHVTMMPNMVAGEGGSLVRTGKLEVRFSKVITKNDAKKTPDWQKMAYNVGHQLAYERQVLANKEVAYEEMERKYSYFHANSEAYRTDLIEARAKMAQDKPIVDAAFALHHHWAWFLLPYSFRKLIDQFA